LSLINFKQTVFHISLLGIFITKSRKDETMKNCFKHFVLFKFRVFVIHFFGQPPTTGYHWLQTTDH